MQGAILLPFAAWQNFYVIIGTAAATLTGLMFVAIGLISGLRSRVQLANDGIATFSTPSVVHVSIALLISALLSAPWPESWNVSVLLGLCGLGGIIYVIIIARRAFRRTSYQPVMEDWLWHTIFPLISYTSFVITAIMIPGNAVPALFLVAAGTILLLFIGIHNAWDNVTYLVVEMVRREDNQQEGKKKDS